jgi:DNA-binding PucR family transcriptional regulator
MVLLPAERAVDDADPALREHLRRLVVHDTRNGTDFVTTLRVYLEAFGSTSLAAERLVLHPNTLRHRISRLCEISGIDLDDPDQRLALALQLRADQHRCGITTVVDPPRGSGAGTGRNVPVPGLPSPPRDRG